MTFNDIRSLFVLCLFIVACFVLVPSQFTYAEEGDPLPLEDKWVYDDAFVLGKTAFSHLNKSARKHQNKTEENFVTLVVEDFSGWRADEYARWISTQWALGKDSVLFLISIHDQKAVIETGRGYRGNISNKIAKDIIDEEIMPYIRSGQYEAGIVAGHDAVIKAYNKKVERNYGAIAVVILAAICFLYGSYGRRYGLNVTIHLGCDDELFGFDFDLF